MDARDTWTTYKVSRRTGPSSGSSAARPSSFTLRAAPGQSLNAAGEIVAWQHDPEPLGNG